VYSFEPLSGPYSKLKRWAEGVTGQKITTFNVALGHEPGWVEMHEHIQLSPHSSLLATTELSHSLYPQTRHQRNERIRMETLDSFLEKGVVELEREILLKLDIQGYEDRVLRGAPEVLRRARACLLEGEFDPLYGGKRAFTTSIRSFSMPASATPDASIRRMVKMDTSSLPMSSSFTHRWWK